jgi:protein subunit release factor B
MTFAPALQARFHRLGIDPSSVIERFVRGTGPGGQKINKTSSTVSLLHVPTGLEVRCQAERSQSANRELAWELMAEKLEARARTQVDAARQELEINRRRNRQKSYGQKVRMIQTKRHRAKHKATRRRVGED